MNDKLIVQALSSVGFRRKELVPEISNIAKLNSIMPEPMVYLKANVINLQKTVKMKPKSDNPLLKREEI